MDEHKEFDMMPETEPEIIPEPEQVQEEAPVIFETEQPTVYRGMGTGRKESPFADSPYLMNHQSRNEEPDLSRHPNMPEQKTARSKARKKGGFLKKLLAWVAALAVRMIGLMLGMG